MKGRTISAIFTLLLVIISFSLYANTTTEGFVEDQKIIFYSQKDMKGSTYEVGLNKGTFRIPNQHIGTLSSVEIPEMYALFVYNNQDIYKFTAVAKLTGRIKDLKQSLSRLPQWTGYVSSAAIIGDYIKVYTQPNFGGKPMYMPSKNGTATYPAGPSNSTEAQTYVRTDIKSFVVPRGLKVIVDFVSVQGQITSKTYTAGAYPDTTIPDVLGVKVSLRSDAYFDT